MDSSQQEQEPLLPATAMPDEANAAEAGAGGGAYAPPELAPTSGLVTQVMSEELEVVIPPEGAAAAGTPRANRQSLMEDLVMKRKMTMRHIFPTASFASIEEEGVGSEVKRAMEEDSEFVRKVKETLEEQGITDHKRKMPPLEIRLNNVNYKVPALGDGGDKNSIATVYNTSPLYKIQRFLKSLKEEKVPKQYLTTNVLSNVNLVLKPQKMYLIIGPPLSGKTSLLRAIAGMLPQKQFAKEYSEKNYFTGQVLYNNIVCSGEGADEKQRNLFRNLVAFVNQLDFHAPRLTVKETFKFAGDCKDPHFKEDVAVLNPEGRLGLVMEALGLSHVADTFVGNEEVRGVSGGQRRRVTLGEMLVFNTPLICGDEISTGLDTASTVDIMRILSYFGRLLNRITVVSLLQPSPEAVSLFDEIILLSDGGNVIFAGPTLEATAYFRKLGYEQPEGMDDADYLLAVASADRKHLYKSVEKAPDGSEVRKEPHSAEAFSSEFLSSEFGSKVVKPQKTAWEVDWRAQDVGSSTTEDGFLSVDYFRMQYRNPVWTSVGLIAKRAFTLWTRDRIFIRGSVIKNIAMGLSVGAVFRGTTLNSSFFGVLFQGNLFIMLGAMTSAPGLLDQRPIFYKHNNSNFYPSFSYVLGQAIALIPQMIMDVLLFGVFVYWMVGFYPSAAGFFLYLALFFTFNVTMGQLFSSLASFAPSKTVVQAAGAVILLLNSLFCGYIVSPATIPPYYIWIYWLVPLSWIYRALLLNEFTREYDQEDADLVLESFGFIHNGRAFQKEWIGYCFAYIIPFLLLCMGLSSYCLAYFRIEPKRRGQPIVAEKAEEKTEEPPKNASLSDSNFIPVNLSFENVCYEVKSSVGSEKLRLLNNVSGVFSAGRLCALMGESGAGKTTLMDVIAMRKGSGEISGNILLNGFAQELVSFRRCSGYVEQFDVQSAELTVRETIRFSALLRLDKSNPVFSKPDGLKEHIDSIIETLELQNEAEVLVGSAEEGGLTFEQKKRLSIAVELAASPSIVFLDEPTSGLDARAALLVMNALRKMCNAGRTIVATIHQPSSAVFEMFDDLLLLKKGGEVVFFGDLGHGSCNLISYFEGLGSSSISSGENPATWMLNVLGEKIITNNGSGEEPLSFSKAWNESSNYVALQTRLQEIKESKDEKLEIKYDTVFAAPKRERNNLMANRLVTIYWRSPAYNLSRMVLSMAIALLLGSIFIPIRYNSVFSETDISSWLGTIFIGFIMIGVLGMTSVIPVMLSIRDMFYRHKAAGMLDYGSVARALATAEKRFILISSVLFCLIFVPTAGIVNAPNVSLKDRAKEGIAFWGFFTFNIAIYSYFGQLFMCLVRGPATASILASVYIGINNFFSGYIVRPQQMTGLWAFTYWINPGHFVYEGLCMAAFGADERSVIVNQGSDYWTDLGCDSFAVDGVCEVLVKDYVNVFFGGLYSRDHIARNCLILAGILIIVRAGTFVALKYLTYSGK